jgi:hypothetical protein
MPKPLEGIVDALQNALRNHWSQILLYMSQAEHFRRWGYPKLAAKFDEYVEEERKHAAACLKRLEDFDSQPNYDAEEQIWPRHDFEGILQVNYTLDGRAADAERAGYLVAVGVGDAESAHVFAMLLKGSEDAMIEIEAIREVIEQIGIDNYLANQT